MGYTHYFPQRRDFTPNEWMDVRTAAKRIIDTAKAEGVVVCFEYDAADKPPVTDAKLIRFNGVGDDGHETFIVYRRVSDMGATWEVYANELKTRGEIFNFCKTAAKPYDVVVTAILAAIDLMAPGALGIESDGEAANWEEGVRLANRALKGHVIPNPLGAAAP